MSNVKSCMITPSDIERYTYHSNYKETNFFDLWRGFSNHGDDSFINRFGITFEDHVGCMALTGNELFYYPTLAKKMREVKNYPSFKKTYKVDEKIKGMDFIEYFYKYVKAVFKQFQDELAQASSIVNNLIYLYGKERATPMIDEIELEKIGEYRNRKHLVINGVRWILKTDPYEKLKITECLEIARLFNISRNDYKKIELEDAIIGTPLIALRIAKTWAHKGQVKWYSLNTLKQIPKVEALRAQ